ncbi:hypothetical protein Gorai_013373 [Gossypium raimondii]|uniref:RNase H type-1 domain-containing protein n=1 Tax=Gossypium raimondii TaxID=29730 RepID=A0A7J8Q4W5_GOSRA|nr:hypothetical protein [Gossypium raimondii]
MESLNGDALNAAIPNVHESQVSDLWYADHQRWNKERVKMLYGDYMGDQICKFPLTVNGSNDRILWFHNPYGYFTSKMAYSWLLLQQVGFGPHRAYWRVIWKLKMLPKIRVFAWRVGHEISSTNIKIASICHGFQKACPRCGACDETLICAFKDCPNAKSVLTIFALDNRLLVKKGKEDDARVVWERANSLSNDFRIHNLVNEPLIPSAPAHQQWRKHPRDFIKVNFDAAVSPNKTGYGVIMRDEDGFVIGGGRSFKEEDLTGEWAEIFTFEESVKLARAMNFSKAVFETDCTSLANKGNRRNLDITIMGTRIKEIFYSLAKFYCVSIR